MKILGQKIPLIYLWEGLKRERLSPSLLFIGPDGVGKKSCAFELAKCFSCLQREDFSSAESDLPRCDQCGSCKRISENNHTDFLIINRENQAIILREKPETQTAIKIESVRYIDKFLRLMPVESQRRIVVVEESQKMTNEAANALLKVLEEPPRNGQIVLLSNDEHAMPPTVVSRCAILRFKPVAVKVISDWLQKNHFLNEEKAVPVAERSNGSFETALRLLDEQETAFDISRYDVEEFFDLISSTNWRRDGRKQAHNALLRLLESSQKKLGQGDISQIPRMRAILEARQQVDRHVSPRLVLENLFLELTTS